MAVAVGAALHIVMDDMVVHPVPSFVALLAGLTP